MLKRHPLIVHVIDSLQFLFREDIIERYVQFHILHIRCYRMQFGEQLLSVSGRKMTGIRKQGIDKPVGREFQGDVDGALKGLLLWRFIRYPGHILLTGDGVDLKSGIQRCQL